MSLMISIRDIGELEEWERFGVARRRARVSQLDLTAESGVPQPYISNWETKGIGMNRDQIERVWTALAVLARQRNEDGAA